MSRGSSWIFRHACGCAFGLSDLRRGVMTEDAAWRSMYPTAAERKTAKASGVTVTLETWEDYSAAGVYDQLSGKWTCPHRGAEVA
jgi:hypothetical protein